MLALYLSAPYSKSQQGSTFYRDFYTILQNGIGPDYAIYSTLIGQIHSGMRVIVFDRVRRLQAEGTASHLTPKPGNRIQRYDVHIRNLSAVQYSSPPRVNRCGVAVL
jgi:hypothetical protein